MVAQSERLQPTERSKQGQRSTDQEQLDRLAEQVREDSLTNSHQYLEETTVPRGGE